MAEMDWNFDDPQDERRAERALKEDRRKGFVETSEFEVDPDRKRESTLSFSRMQTDWRGEDRDSISMIRSQANHYVRQRYREAFQLLWDIYVKIREAEHEIDPQTGEVTILKEPTGEPKWKRDQFGNIVEHWDRMTLREREEYILRISLFLVECQQKAADDWGEAMMAKAYWEENFVLGFRGAKGTNDHRTNEGKYSAREARYFALFRAWVSRKADALVKSMERLDQRLKDTNF